MDNGVAGAIRLEFLRRSVVTAKELAANVGVSQPTISRAIAELGDSIVRIGRGATSRYGMSAPIGNLGARWPLYILSPTGAPEQVGELHALAGGAWYLDAPARKRWSSLVGDEFTDGVFPGLPWFLDDTRPQGFLGRAFARRFGPGLGFPLDPARWSNAEVAVALLQYGSDLPGAFVLGGDSLKQAFAPASLSPPVSDPMESYPGLAEAALAGDVAGSSVGGEQPKFVASLNSASGPRHVIVKFSGPVEIPENRRWSDLLVAEHLASEVLRAGGIPASVTTVLDIGSRRYLEVERFDRIGADGRRPVVSLRALEAAFFGEPHTPWTAAADRLEQGGWLVAGEANRLRTLWHFGELIANSDMHYGNVSLFLNEKRPLALAPVYDMLPMAYRPGAEGRLPTEPASQPSMEALRDSVAVQMAASFWKAVGASHMVSNDFREIARQQESHLERAAIHRPLVEGSAAAGETARQDPRTFEDHQRRGLEAP